MKNLLKSVFAAAMLLLMVACNGSKTNEAYPLPMKYLPVQLEGSKMWSILDLESGDVVVKDVYKAMPSAVVNDMYFVMNDEGTFDYYNVADPKKPRNKGTLEGSNVQLDMNNPTCGDRIHLTLQVDDNIVTDAKFEGEGCSISM